MKVYLGYECYYNGLDTFEFVAKVFDDEAKALVWLEEVKLPDDEWRKYKEVEVE